MDYGTQWTPMIMHDELCALVPFFVFGMHFQADEMHQQRFNETV